MSKVSVIVRTKNEEFWIERCLRAIFTQKSQYEVEVVLVDNSSTDATIERAKSVSDAISIVTLDKYNPSVSLNLGIKAATGDYCICISAHCVPADEYWLENLIEPLSDQELCAVYGRQIPLLTSNPNDKRDLWLTFGLDDVVQKNDPFIHNANAAYRTKDLLAYPFDEKLTNIEDRSWGQTQINLGNKIYYKSNAVVYHDHGIHQTGSLSRLRGVIGMMDIIHRNDSDISMYYGNPSIYTTPKKALFILVSERYGTSDAENLKKKYQDIKLAFEGWEIICFPTTEHIKQQLKDISTLQIRDNRIIHKGKYAKSLLKDLSNLYLEMCDENNFYDFVGYFDIREDVPSNEVVIEGIEQLMLQDTDWAFAGEETFVASSSFKDETTHILAESGWTSYFEPESLESIVQLNPNKLLFAKAYALREIIDPLNSYSVIDVKHSMSR